MDEKERVSQQGRYLIQDRQNGEFVYWALDKGWVDLASADTFSQEERDTLNLPIGKKVQWVGIGFDIGP